jgi:DNA-binding CsgD family transcriptional regulator
VPLYLRDDSEARTLSAAVNRARDEAAVGALPALLFSLARDQATTSGWTEASANYGESARLAAETGQVTERLMSTAGLCWLESRQGREASCRAHATEVLEHPAVGQLHMAVAWVRHALGDLELSLGEPGRAVLELRRLTALLAEHEMADVDLVPGPELVEALLRLGQGAEAATTAAAYEQAAEAKGQPWALARAARARGLVAADDDGDEAQRWFERALETHEATLDVFETARTRLAYGERLRRAGQRTDARTQLRPALETFEELGAERWGARAAAELAATGESVRRRGADPRSLLTAQELQVSLLLVEGRTTRETAAALFLSPKTVEYHLRKVYTKLDVRSRSELAEFLRG